MVDPLALKRCPYCQHSHPKDDFVKLKKGKWGQITTIMCGPCHRARQNPEANKKRLDIMVENNKAANRRAYGYFEKEKSR